MHSVKELEHYKRVREAFESSSSPSEQDDRKSGGARSDTIKFSASSFEHSAQPQANGRRAVRKDSKGKGKASKWDNNEMEDDDDDEAYVTSNDYGGTPQKQQYRNSNGGAISAHSKGKARESMTGGTFQDEDEDLYGD